MVAVEVDVMMIEVEESKGRYLGAPPTDDELDEAFKVG